MSLKKTISIVLMVAAGAAGGWLANGLFTPATDGPATSESGSGPCPGGAEPTYWKAPMDPTYVRDAPGKSPMGMDLVPVCAGEDDELPAGAVRIKPGMIQNMGVRMARVERRDLTRVVRAVGRVVFDERLVEHVHIKVQGWIEKLYVKYEGEMVKRGQPLLELYSPELVSTQEELLIAARYRGATSDSPFPDVKRGGDDLFEATRRRLELWDIPQRDIDQLLDRGIVRKTLTLYAPASGVVTHLMVRKGMEVGANDNLYTISDLSRVWVHADVYEYELAWIAEGQRGVIELSYLPGVTLEGVVTYIYPYLDPKTRTARVRLELDNPDGVLKPDMFANVSIEAETRKSVLAVPEEAVIRSGRRNLIVVALGDGRFQPREVTLGLETGDGWLEVRDGLLESESVVTSGQFLIDSESKLQEAFQKILARDADSTDSVDRAEPSMPNGEMEEASHEGHAMPAEAAGAAEHEGHAMPAEAADAAEHEGHAMPAESAGAAEHAMPAGETSHDGQDMGPHSNEPKE
jgi:Cu(I)/Ag(I) efflux system membrane fusion protein/cobalt-zinc-cadmium efflux system membrane fusion protein